MNHLRPERSDLVDLAAIFSLTCLALVAFRSSFGGTFFLVVGVLGAVMGVAIGHIWNRLDLAWPFGGLAVALGYVVVLGAIALPDRSILGLIPTIGSMTAAATTAVGGWKELLTTTTPIGRTGDLMVLPALCGVVSGYTGVVLARRVITSPVALFPPLVVLGLGIATGLPDPVSLLLHGAVIAMVTVGWLAYREHARRPLLESGGRNGRRVASASLVITFAAVGGFLIADLLPGAEANARSVWRPIVPEFDPQQYPSPLASYRDYVKATECRIDGPTNCADLPEEERDPVMFTVEGLPVDVPVRLATMDEYDGLVWRVAAPGEQARPLERSGAFEKIGALVEPEFEGEIADVVITIGEYSDVWVPDVGEVLSLRFVGSSGGQQRDRDLTEAFRYNQATDTAASPLPLQAGDRYEMTVRLPVVLDKFAGEEIIGSVPGLGSNRQVSEITNKLSSADLLIIGDDGERLDFVRDLMFRLGTYSDGDVSASQIRAKPGHSAFRLTEFVQGYPKTPLIGNAEQYASTFGLMFRDVGDLPTRLVMGFRPSDSSTEQPVEVRATEVDAWVELPFVQHGWVGIFPTPPRDQTSIQTSTPQQPEPDYRTQNPPPPPLIDPEFDQAATRSGKAQATVDEESSDEESSNDAGGAPRVFDFFTAPAFVATLVLSSPLLVLLTAGLVVVLIKRRRRKRRRAQGRAHERIANGWREVTDYATDMGRVVPKTTTRREAAALVGSSTRALADRADAAVWSAGEPDEAEVDAYWDALAGSLAEMRSQLGFVERIKTAVSLQSLRRRKEHALTSRAPKSVLKKRKDDDLANDAAAE